MTEFFNTTFLKNVQNSVFIKNMYVA